METILAPLVCYLLTLSFKVAHAENQNMTTTPANLGSNLTEFTITSTSPSSTETEDTAEYTSTKQNNETFTTTVAATENTSQHQTSQSATPLTSPTPTTQSSALTIPTQTTQSATHFISTSDTPVSSTINSSQTITTSTFAVNTTEGLRLNIPERNMTIIFSGMLGLFALAIVMIMFYKCKHKIQYLHQPLTTTDETDGFVADDDTLVISGGLYDGHPIYDNVPPPPAEHSQFHLEFLR